MEAPHILTYYFRPELPVSYQAGQFALFTLKHNNQDDWGDGRWFTISSSPNEDLLSITVKFVAKEGSTYTEALRRITTNDTLEMSQPQGEFILPEDHSIPLIFIAGGIGIAPYRSMVRWIKMTNQNRDIRLLYAVSDEKDIIFEDMIKELGSRVTLYNEHLPTSTQCVGRKMSAEDVYNLAGKIPTAKVFISGPNNMVNGLYDELRALNIHSDRIVRDAF